MSDPAHFVTTLDARRIHGSRKRHILAPLVFYSAKLGQCITVPQGFIYNGPSAPIIWGGDGESSSAVHDFMYSRPDLYTRAQADAVLREALEVEGMNFARRNWWWLGVRLFGGFFYAGKEQRNEADSPVDHSPGA